MTPVILDASAVLVYLHGEPGWEIVDAALLNQACAVTAANHAEIIARSLDRGVASSSVVTMLDTLGYEVLDITAADGQRAGMLRMETRSMGLSLGDRLCFALALRLGATVITADRPWLTLARPMGLDICCIRPETS